MRPYDCYIICGTPRSGSTLLCNLLRDAGCGRPRSYFRRQSIARIAAELGVSSAHDPQSKTFAKNYVDAVRNAGKGGSEIFGLRVMYENLGEMLAFLRIGLPENPDVADPIETAFGHALFIHLSREDKVAQAISLLKAEHSGLWHISPDGREIERTAPHREPSYDGARIASLIGDLARDEAGWDAWFSQNGVNPLRMSYEQLAREPHSVIADILASLGRDPSIAASLPISTGKLGDERSAEWNRRFRAEQPPA